MPSLSGPVGGRRLTLLSLLSLLASSLAARGAHAQASPTDERSFDVQLFHAPIGPGGFITLDSARAARHKQLSLTLLSNYQRGPFQITIESEQAALARKFD